MARETLAGVLGEVDAELLRRKPRHLRCIGFRERGIVTLFLVFLLDRALGLGAEECLSPGLKEVLVLASSWAPFRQTVKLFSFLPVQVSAMTVHEAVAARSLTQRAIIWYNFANDRLGRRASRLQSGREGAGCPGEMNWSRPVCRGTWSRFCSDREKSRLA